MGRLPEPEDLDIVVDGRDSDPESLRETSEFIRAYKSRPEYADEIREARRILDAIKINSTDYGMTDPAALLEHWKRCVEDLTRDDQEGQANGELH